MKKKILSIALALTMMLSLALPAGTPAMAASNPASYIFDVSEGNITVASGGGGNIHVTYGAAQATTADFANTQEITITGTTTANKVFVTGVTAKITLSSADIQIPGTDAHNAFTLSGGANVTLTVTGSNTLKGSANGNGGLTVPSGQTVTIQGTGTLTAVALSNAAGIGGYSDSKPCGTISILSGTVIASGGGGGSGIGGTNGGNGGTINISGGTVTATGDAGAGIGGGQGASGGSITISGGFITASTIYGGAGIGGGCFGPGGTINISGGTVTATGSSGGAGIGGGEYYDATSTGATGTITISGGTVAASGGRYESSVYGGAGIGCGINGAGMFDPSGSVTITAAATVKASAYGTALPAILPVTGAGTAKILLANFAAVKAANTSTAVYIKSSSSLCAGFSPAVAYQSIAFTVPASTTYQLRTTASGILQQHNAGPSTDFGIASNGITQFSSVTNVTTTTLDVSDSSGTYLPTGVTYTANLFTIGTGANNSTITVQGTTTSNTIAVSTGVSNLTLILNGVSITSASGSPIDLQGTANVTIQLANGTTNTLNASSSSSLVPGLRVNNTAAVDISGSGTLNATGALFGAGIGGGSGGTGGTITVTGGSVNATGGQQAAGIGGGNASAGGAITISGGTVSATGNHGGAGIGGGQQGAGGNIAISGSAIVTAIGGYSFASAAGGAGIGGGYLDASGGVITISGAPTITAVSGNKPAIDAAAGSSGGFINAKLNSTISTSADTYVRCNGIVLTLPAYYKSFAFGSAAASAVSAYSNAGCTTLIGNIVQDSDDSLSISVTDLSVTPANVTSVKLQTFALTVNLDGGNGGPLGGSYNSGAVISIDAGTKSGYTFSGWISSSGGSFGNGGNASTTFTMPGNATTITAIWTAVPTYALTVNLNGGSGATTGGSYASGASVSINAGTKNGYTFNGWTSSSGGSFGNGGNASTTFTIPGNATTITANWTAVPTYVLSVNLNGGSGSTVGGSYASGATVSIDAGTKSGYTFNGWSSTSGGSFDDAGSASTTFTMPGNATTITASWTAIVGPAVPANPPANSLTVVIVDGKDHAIGTEKKDDTSTTATVDQGKLADEIAKASEGSSTIFPVSSNTNITAQLVVKNVEAMAQKDMILTVRTGNVSYNLSTTAIDTVKITSALGTAHTESILFNVSISNSSAVVNGAAIVVSPVEFTITATYNGKTVTMDTFSCFIDRTIEITADQAKQSTTAVVVSPDGSLRHVPTKVVIVNGKYYAVINSLTNSTYTVVWHPVEFSDVTGSWAKASINNMGSRMVVAGVGNNNFEPNRDITRAEFAAIIVRALGLAPGVGKNGFSDVHSTDWYCGYVETAAAYGIITGYTPTTFGPLDMITREQAMTMVARAMTITKLAPTLSDARILSVLSNYADASAISDYARAGAAACIDTGVILGRPNNAVAPKEIITRAEVAVIVERMLQKSGLI